VKDKDKHIRQQPGDAYPKPEIPAEGAWSGMKDMLDQEMPVSANNAFNWIKITKLFSALAVTCAGLIYFISQNTNNPLNKTTTDAPKSTIALTEHESRKGLKELSEAKNATTSTKQSPDVNSNTEKSAKPETGSPAVSVDNLNKSDSGKININNTSRKTSFEASGKTKKTLSELPESTKAKASGSNKTHQKYSNIKTSDAATRRKEEPGISNKNQSSTSENSFDGNKRDRFNKEIISGKLRDKIADQVIANQDGEKITGTRNNATVLPETRGEKLTKIHSNPVSLLNGRRFVASNNLERNLKSLTIKSTQITKASSQNPSKGAKILNDVHVGLLFDMNVPFSGYDGYFTGTKNNSDFYKTLIPGIWVGKTFHNGSEILVKGKFNSQYFGKKKDVDSLSFQRTDSAENIYLKNKLVKINGFNAGIQYNQRLNDKFLVGFGTTLQWQQKALLRQTITISDSTRVIDYPSLTTITQKTDTANYLKPLFLSANVEIVYAWKRFQFAAGLLIPVTSMISSPYKKIRPISGQVTVRWRGR
jgi:hypothetical protein